MLLPAGALLLLGAIALWAYTIAAVLRTPEGAFRNANQIAWLLVVILVPLIGVPLYWVMEGAARNRFPGRF